MPDARDYLRGKPRQGGTQIEDLEFTNEIGGETLYVMRKEGNPTGSEDTKAVINLGYALSNFYSVRNSFSGSQSSSLFPASSANYFSSQGSAFQVTFAQTGSQKIANGTAEVYLNGLALESNLSSQFQSTNADFFISGSNQIVVKRPSAEKTGYNLSPSESIIIKFQQGV